MTTYESSTTSNKDAMICDPEVLHTGYSTQALINDLLRNRRRAGPLVRP